MDFKAMFTDLKDYSKEYDKNEMMKIVEKTKTT